MSFDPEKVTFFAQTDARGQNMRFGIKAKDRQRHMYVVGKTGMGKSTMLENMAVQDIQNGEGMAFIDPHGSAAETLLNYIPEHRINDVVYFAPFDTNFPVAFNVMEDVGEDKRHLVVSGLMSTFKKIWVDAWSARMEYILTNTLLALLEYPDSTLLSVNRMLADKAYRKRVVEYVKDPAVKSFWVDEFANYTDRFAAEATPAIQNKVGQFTGNPLIRNIIGQPKSSFDIRKLMDEKKILIMNLSKGLVGETNANLLGSMLTTRIYLAAMSRADLSPQQMATMPNFYFYVDEFQSFANATFANILSEARKYHLNLTIAHQYITQMEEEVRDAVFGNVGTTVTFRVGPFDAELLETVFTPTFLAPDLVNLGFAQIYLTLMIDGIGSQPFSATTLPPIQPPAISHRDMVIAASRKQYAHTREAVEEAIGKFHEPVVMEKPKRATIPQAVQQNNSSTNQRGNHTSGAPRGEKNNDNRSSSPSRNGNERPAPRAVPQREEGERGEHRRREPRERREKRKENVGELRSILKNISAENQRTPISNKVESDPRQRQKKEPDPKAKDELKNLIAGVLKQQPQKNDSAEKNIDASPKPTYTPAPESKVPESGVPTQANSSASKQPVVDSPISSAPPPVQKENTPQAPPQEPPTNNISPKELERMMRVTSGDQPRLK